MVVLFLLFSPSGGFGSWMVEQMRAVNEKRLIGQTWDRLIDSPSALHDATLNGKPIVVEFLDYQCPACRAVAASVSAVAERGTVGIVVRHLPLEGIHPEARDAARAAVCAEAQGRFHEAHEALLSDAGWIERGDWIGLGEAVGIADPVDFAGCLEGGGTDARVELDKRLAEILGIAATPSFVTREGIYHGEAGFRNALRDLN